MKCNCLVQRTTKRRKGSGQYYTAVIKPITWWQLFLNPDTPTAAYQPCGGNIIAIAAGGGTFDLTFKCDHCGSTFYPHLPQDAQSLSEFLTEQIAQLDDEPLIAATKAKYLAEQARWANLREIKK